MNDYILMRLSESMDDDGPDYDELRLPEHKDPAVKFKEKYKEFYTDVKLDIKEDW